MEKCKKRDRNVNFTVEEMEKLVSLVEAFKSIIENKKSDSVTWQEKERAWRAIENDYNSSGVSSVFRDAKHLKQKYEALKRDTRKKTSYHSDWHKNGGIPRRTPVLTKVEEKVRNMISLSVEGDESMYNSDSICSLDISNTTPVEIMETKLTPVQGDIISFEEHTQNHLERNSSQEIEMEYVAKKRCTKRRASTSQVNENRKWSEWRPETVTTNKKPPFSEEQARRPYFNKYAEENNDLQLIQKQLAVEEMEEKQIKKQILQEQLEQNRVMHELQKQEMLLKIALLKEKIQYPVIKEENC